MILINTTENGYVVSIREERTERIEGPFGMIGQPPDKVIQMVFTDELEMAGWIAHYLVKTNKKLNKKKKKDLT